MAKTKTNSLMVPTVRSGDSYVEAYQEAIETITERIIENSAFIKEKLSSIVVDVYKLYQRKHEWGIERDVDFFTKLHDLTDFSVKYLRDVLKIGEMLFTHDQIQLLELASLRTLRLIAYKSEKDQSWMLKEVEKHYYTESQIQQIYHRLNPPSDLTKPNSMQLKTTELRKTPFGYKKIGDRNLVWFNVSDHPDEEELNDLKETLELLHKLVNRLEQGLDD